MSNTTVTRLHWSFWVIGAIALTWNGMGVLNYFMQMTSDSLAAYPETHRAIIAGRPAWATGAFAIAVFGGTLGCVLLLLRKSASYYFFIASLLGVIVTMIHTLGITGLIDALTAVEISMMILGPPAVALFLLWYSKWAERKGWIS